MTQAYELYRSTQGHVHACSWTQASMCAQAHRLTRTHARTHTRTHARTHAHTHARTHARTHTHIYARNIHTDGHICLLISSPTASNKSPTHTTDISPSPSLSLRSTPRHLLSTFLQIQKYPPPLFFLIFLVWP